MWKFVSPDIVFGLGALDALDELDGQRALIVTDRTLVELGAVERVVAHLSQAGIDARVFDGVEPEPSLGTVAQAAAMAGEWSPDWIVGLGGGSPMDAAKAVRILYERPDLQALEITPQARIELGRPVHLLTIPTTSGTGSEVTWTFVLSDPEAQRVVSLGHPAAVADLAVVDPELAATMPAQLTADTGLDALTHAVEGYTCSWHTDLSDGLCLKAARLILGYLPRAVEDGDDMVARERMHNAATCAGLGFGNAMASLAHAMGHTLSAVFGVPHGRAVGVLLPYVIEFAGRIAPQRIAELGVLVGCVGATATECAVALARRLRALCQVIGSPLRVEQLGIGREAFEAHLQKLTDDAFNDTQTGAACRVPTYEELAQLWRYAHQGKAIDF
jgi:alcohol dehydrogenase class IV